MQSEVEKQMNLSGGPTSPTAAGAAAAGVPGFPTIEEKMEADNRSVYVGNVDYTATAEELEVAREKMRGRATDFESFFILNLFTGSSN